MFSVSRRLPPRPLVAALLVLPMALVGCAPGGDSGSASQSLIMDELHNGGTEGFLFLPPMVPKPAHVGDIVPGVPVTVQIDELDAKGGTLRTVASFTTDSGPMGERVRYHLADAPPGDNDGDLDPMGFYLARWRTNDENLSLSAIYRVRVKVPARSGGSRELGFADVDVVRNQKQFRSVDRQEFTPLIDGDTLRIKFRIDRPSVDWDLDGVLDWNDNCPTTANADQADSLGNGIGDACRCDALPANFGGIHCAASFGTCDGKGGPVNHDFGGKAIERDGVVSVACTSDAPVVDAKLATTVHNAPMVLACDGGVAFDIIRTGPGHHVCKARDAKIEYSLRYDEAMSSDSVACTIGKGDCHRVSSEIHIAVEDLRAQGLSNCHLYFGATATAGAGVVENGRLLDRGDSYPLVAFDRLPVTGIAGELLCAFHPLDGNALDGKPSLVRTRCAQTADTARPTERLPTLCSTQADGAKEMATNTFADLHSGYGDAAKISPDKMEAGGEPIRRAPLGRVGQPIGGTCPGVVPVINQSEAFALPRTPGALTVTATAKLNASEALSSWYRQSVDVSVAVGGDGLPLLEVAKGLSVASVEKGLVVQVPDAYAKAANPTTVIKGTMRQGVLPAPVGADVIICFFDTKPPVCAIMDVDTELARPTARVTEIVGGPIDKPDLCLDVDVK